MAIPIQTAPIFSCKLPSTGKEIRYHPYTVKEEKILLIALQSENDKDILNAIKQVVTNCVVSEHLDVDELTIYDFEYLMLKIRSKSAEDKLIIKFKGREGTECEYCKKEKALEIDLNEIEVEKTPGHTNKILVTETSGFILHHPTLKDSSRYDINDKNNRIDVMVDLIIDCMDGMFDSEKTYSPKDFSREEMHEMIEGLTQPQFKKLEVFFNTMPVLKKTLDLSCKECGYEEFYTLQRLQDFFG